jgi:hypothetical protein
MLGLALWDHFRKMHNTFKIIFMQYIIFKMDVVQIMMKVESKFYSQITA